MNLYGPLYGNRMIHAAGVKAVEEYLGCSIKEHVEHICANRDRDSLDNWRGYYRRRLYPFDVQLQDRVRVYVKVPNIFSKIDFIL